MPILDLELKGFSIIVQEASWSMTGTEVRFVPAVTTGGSVEFLPKRKFLNFLHFCVFLSLKLLTLGEIDGVKVLAWKFGSVKFWTNLMSGQVMKHLLWSKNISISLVKKKITWFFYNPERAWRALVVVMLVAVDVEVSITWWQFPSKVDLAVWAPWRSVRLPSSSQIYQRRKTHTAA